jgi:outer membrane assembly lipoprotein YfiO
VGVLAAMEAASSAQGRRVWKDGKWVEAAEPRKGSPAGDLARIRSYRQQGKPGKALKEARRFLRRYADHDGRQEALMLAAEAQMDRGRYFSAFEWLERLLNEYPSGPFFDRALSREYEIAEAFLRGRKRRVLGLLRFSATEEGLEILVRIAEHAPASAIARKAVLRIGDHHYGKRQYAEAAEAYDQFVRLFAKSRQAEYASLQAARATLRTFKGLDFDDTPLLEAQQRFRTFAERYPEAAKRLNVAGTLRQIAETRGQKAFETARFYARTRGPKPAAFYYGLTIRDYPDTEWAAKARRALREMGIDEAGTAAETATQDASLKTRTDLESLVGAETKAESRDENE